MEIVDDSLLENGTNISALFCDIILENDTFFCVDDSPHPAKGMYMKIHFFQKATV